MEHLSATSRPFLTVFWNLPKFAVVNPVPLRPMSTHPNDPITISPNEWEEIISLQEVRESWGLDDKDTLDEFRSMVYGVKFDFVSGGPGYVGEIYILHGDVLSGDLPLILGRYDGQLKPVYD